MPKLFLIDLIIFDELDTYLSFSQIGVALIFHLLSNFHEHTSLIITTNLPSTEGNSVFIYAEMTIRPLEFDDAP